MKYIEMYNLLLVERLKDNFNILEIAIWLTFFNLTLLKEWGILTSEWFENYFTANNTLFHRLTLI